MKTFLLSLSLLVTASAFGQNLTAAKFAGEYIGIASPAKWKCDERVVIDVFVTPAGVVDVLVYSYDLDIENGFWETTVLDANGRFVTSIGGYTVSAKVSAAGSVRGSAIGTDCKYTFTALRRFKAAYDPAL